MENQLRENVEDYTAKKESRNIKAIERAKEEALELGMLNASGLIQQGKFEEAFE